MAHALKEVVLLDTAPVVTGRVYLVDGRPKVATVTGQISDLKTALGASTVKNWDAIGRSVGWLDDAFGA
jgi:hypothetical protein